MSSCEFAVVAGPSRWSEPWAVFRASRAVLPSSTARDKNNAVVRARVLRVIRDIESPPYGVSRLNSGCRGRIFSLYFVEMHPLDHPRVKNIANDSRKQSRTAALTRR